MHQVNFTFGEKPPNSSSSRLNALLWKTQWKHPSVRNKQKSPSHNRRNAVSNMILCETYTALWTPNETANVIWNSQYLRCSSSHPAVIWCGPPPNQNLITHQFLAKSVEKWQRNRQFCELLKQIWELSDNQAFLRHFFTDPAENWCVNRD